MANLDIPNLLGGVSKQPFTQKQVNEAEEQINCFNSYDDGMGRRQASFNINPDVAFTDIKSFTKLHETDELQSGSKKFLLGKFIVQTQLDDLYTINTLGDMDLIAFASGAVETDFKNYVSDTGDTEIQYLTINDSIFVYNPEAKVLKDTVNLTAPLFTDDKDGYVHVKNSDVNRRYSLSLEFGTSGQSSNVFFESASFNSTKQIARKLISFNEQENINGGDVNAYQILAGNNNYDTPSTYTIKRSDASNNPIAFDITITGDTYDASLDTFSRETIIYNFPTGVSSITTGTDLWGSMKIINTSIAPDVNILGNPTGPTPSSFDQILMINGTTDFTNGPFDVFPRNDIIAIQSYTGTVDIVNINTSDDFGDQNMFQIFGTMKTIDLLPSKFFHNTKIRIAGDPITDQDDYYVIFKVNNATVTNEFGSGVFIEDVAGDIEQFYDLTTMPFVITDDGAGNKTLDRGDWNNLGSRLVGDDVTNQYPAFTDNKITSMFLFGNRLCIASENKISLSENDNLFNHFQTSVVALLQGDPIGVTITSDKNIHISHAIPFQERLLLISENAQFNMVYRDTLTLDTLRVVETSAFNTSRLLRPIKSNNILFFISNYGLNTQVNEFFYEDISLVNGNIVTERIEDYIPSDIELSDVNKANDILALSKKGSNEVYIYQYLFKGKDKLVNAWNKWTFDNADIQRIAFYDDQLFIFHKASNGRIELIKVSVSKSIEPTFIYLDYIGVQSTASTPVAGISTITFLKGNILGDIADVRINTFEETGYELPLGFSHEIISAVPSGDNLVITFKEPDNLWDSDKTYAMGFNYNSEYEFSTLILRDREGRTINRGRTQLLNISLTYNDTAAFVLETQILKGDVKQQIFTGKKMGSPNNILDSLSFETGTDRFYIGSKNTDLTMKIKSVEQLAFQIESANVELRFWDRRV